MQLTQYQEACIARYLRDVAVHLDGSLPARDREAGIERLEANLRRAFEALGKETPPDTEFAQVLASFGAPEDQARAISRGAGAEPGRVWLGVCNRWAKRLQIPAWLVRMGMILLGVTGPLAVLVYLAGYAEKVYHAPKGSEPPIDWTQVLARVVPVLFMAILLHVAGGYAIRGIEYLYQLAMHRPLPHLGDWGWIRIDRQDYFFYAVVSSVPLAVLSGMPLAGGWDYTLKRLAQAILAVYAMALSFGIASILAGLLLELVKEFGGSFSLDIFKDIFKPTGI